MYHETALSAFLSVGMGPKVRQSTCQIQALPVGAVDPLNRHCPPEKLEKLSVS